MVVGGGLIGLCAAAALAERGVSCTIIGTSRPGEASPAAAGMLAPSVEQATGSAHDFAIAARDRYPSYVEYLAERTGVHVPLNRRGILQVAITEKGVKGLKKTAPSSAQWMEADELRKLEPSLGHALGAMFNVGDGAVDNTILLGALQKLIAKNQHISRVASTVTKIVLRAGSCDVILQDKSQRTAERVVLAAGAWVGKITGARFAGAVKPARGQLVSYSSTPLRHVAYGPRGYVVPRADSLIGGSTMEDVGFDSKTTPAGIKKVRAAAEEICPVLESTQNVTAWAGLRPVTPDMLPIIGADPEYASLLYACGHSRNGVLMAPLTGDIIADLVTGSPLSHDLAQFRPDRF
ncbi:MAG TPA: FAD-dependent oxidoreductase [Gemmatimonadaceae bacterium]|nr:FAD-dependent oxidoreductase [Gemmatimonadaceae bacterium]